MDDPNTPRHRMNELVSLDEDRFLAGFHLQAHNPHQKAWHDHHIRLKEFQVGDLVLMYESKFHAHLGKLRMYWLGPY